MRALGPYIKINLKPLVQQYCDLESVIVLEKTQTLLLH